jgi:hypothetical protein
LDEVGTHWGFIDMFLRTWHAATRRVSVLAALWLPGFVSAQVPSHFEALVLPPDTVGTCMPLRISGARADSAALRGSRLVMKSRVPGRQREMTVFVDPGGRSIGFADRTFTMTDARSGGGSSVTAFLDSLGGVRGFRIQNAVAYPDSLPLPNDLASLQAMKEHMTASSSRRLLDARENAAVQSLVRFLRQRCPT